MKQLIFLGIPVLEEFKAHTVDCLTRMFFHWVQFPVFELRYSIIIGSRQIHFARNELVAAAMREKADYMAFIDADMTFPPDILHRLYYHSKDITGVLYKGRVKPHPYNLFYNKDGDPVQVKKSWKPPKDKLIEVDAVGTGVMLIRKKVFEELPQPYFFYEAGRSEDIMFCREARRKGFRIHVDTSLKCGHIGDHIYE